MIEVDSRKIKPGDTFICLPGGEAYIQDAISNGAIEVLKMTRVGLADFARETYDNPSAGLTVVGVTGTNGKTTITRWVSELLSACGKKVAVLGTLNAELTTPESLHILRAMAEHKKKGGTHFVLEVSSHGIKQGRLLGVDFDIKLLSNLAQDHLDYHGSLDDYHQTKLGFMKKRAKDKDGCLSLYPQDYQSQAIPNGFHIPGSFNQENLKAALSACLALGLSQKALFDSVPHLTPAPGRFESINEGQPFSVIVDFAHTPDSLEKILIAGKEMADKKGSRLLCLFGCGGDRDKQKRPLMGKIASSYAQSVVLTNDNPRSEDPDAILGDISEGIVDGYEPLKIIPDRRSAISAVLNQANADDVVILAGKGHETYQIVGDKKLPFDDREEARKWIKRYGRLDRY